MKIDRHKNKIKNNWHFYIFLLTNKTKQQNFFYKHLIFQKWSDFIFDFACGSPTYFDTIFSGRDFNFFLIVTYGNYVSNILVTCRGTLVCKPFRRKNWNILELGISKWISVQNSSTQTNVGPSLNWAFILRLARNLESWWLWILLVHLRNELFFLSHT